MCSEHRGKKVPYFIASALGLLTRLYWCLTLRTDVQSFCIHLLSARKIPGDNATYKAWYRNGKKSSYIFYDFLFSGLWKINKIFKHNHDDIIYHVLLYEFNERKRIEIFFLLKYVIHCSTICPACDISTIGCL